MAYSPYPQISGAISIPPNITVCMEMQAINSQLQAKVDPQTQAIGLLYQENLHLRRTNAAQHMMLKGFAIPAAKDIISGLLDKFKSNARYREVLQTELRHFCKINVDEFLMMLEAEVKSSQEPLDDGWTFLGKDDPNADFRPALREYILKTLDVPRPENRSMTVECLKSALGYTGAATMFTLESLWAFTRLSFFCVELGVGALILFKSPLIPFALLILRAYLKV